MLTITIEAATPESAHALFQALAGHVRILRQGDDGRQFVDVDLPRGDREIVEVLNTIEDYVTHRNDGPARVELDGRVYMLHAAT